MKHPSVRMAVASGRIENLTSALPSPGYHTIGVADRVIAFVSTEPRTGVVTGNSVAVAGDDSILVVDSGHFPSLAKRMIAEIREAFKKPVRYLVNTHWHPDHWIGNYLYREEFPHVAIFSYPFTRRQIENEQVNYPREALERVPAILNTLRESLQAAKRRDGTPLSAEDMQYLKYQIDDAEAFVPELQQMRVEPPTVTLERGASASLGKREVKIMHLGRGNTAGDIVAYVPDAKVLMTGDLVVYPTPYSFGSYLSEWVETLRETQGN